METKPPDHTISDWISIYKKIISDRSLKSKTVIDKNLWLKYLEAEFGARTIDSVMPFELAAFARKVALTGKETAARRIIIESKDLFYEALLYGWIFRNPADSVRPIRPKIKRRRLSLDGWQEMHAQTVEGAICRRLLRLALVSAQRRADLCAVRFSDVRGGHLHIVQQKTGRHIRIPLDLRMDALNASLGDVIEECRDAAAGSPYMLPMRSGAPSQPHRLTWLFSQCRKKTSISAGVGQTLPTLHEVRSLAERLYRFQGVDTQTLLGHKFPRTTNLYNDDRGSSAGEWKTVRLKMPAPREIEAESW